MKVILYDLYAVIDIILITILAIKVVNQIFSNYLK